MSNTILKGLMNHNRDLLSLSNKVSVTDNEIGDFLYTLTQDIDTILINGLSALLDEDVKEYVDVKILIENLSNCNKYLDSLVKGIRMNGCYDYDFSWVTNDKDVNVIYGICITINDMDVEHDSYSLLEIIEAINKSKKNISLATYIYQNRIVLDLTSFGRQRNEVALY